MYGNTKSAAQILPSKPVEKGCANVWVYDVSQLVSESFRLSHLVFASVTYNLGIYPYLMHLKALNFQNRTCAIIESMTKANETQSKAGAGQHMLSGPGRF